MKLLMTLALTLGIAACGSTPKTSQQPTPPATEGGGNNSASGTMSGTPATGGTDPRGAGDDAPSAPKAQPSQEPPPSDAGTNTGGAASGPNRGASPTVPR